MAGGTERGGREGRAERGNRVWYEVHCSIRLPNNKLRALKTDWHLIHLTSYPCISILLLAGFPSGRESRKPSSPGPCSYVVTMMELSGRGPFHQGIGPPVCHSPHRSLSSSQLKVERWTLSFKPPGSEPETPWGEGLQGGLWRGPLLPMSPHRQRPTAGRTRCDTTCP